MKKFICYCFSVILFFIITPQLHAQNDSIVGVARIDYYLENNELADARSELQNQIEDITTKNQIDSLYQFPLYIGKVTLAEGNASIAGKEAEKFIEDLKRKRANDRTLFKAYLSLDKLYLELGDDTNCVAASKKALEHAKKLDDLTPDELGKINYIIGGNYYALYDLSNAVDYFRESAIAYEQSTTVKKYILADSYNGVAVSMWTLNKLDSAQVYFNKAILAAKESDLTAFDRTYYINAFKFNLALVIDAQGRISEAIEIKKEIIKNFQDIIEGSKDAFLVKKSKRLQASAISNLAAFYNDTGYLTKAYDMLQYAYEKKKEVFESTSPRMATALSQIALSEIELQEFDKSIETTNLALKNLRESTNKYLSVEADILYMQAKAYTEKKETASALSLFQESEALYRKAYPDEYSQEYLMLLRDYALFLVKNGNQEKGISFARKTYDYVLKNGGENNFPLLKEIVSLTEVYYESGDFENSLQWAEEGMNFINEKLKNAASSMDANQIEFYKPYLLLLQSKSEYELTSEKDESFLKSLLDQLDEATLTLEKRKTTVYKTEDIQALLSNYKFNTDFSKKIALELYEKTNSSAYLDRIIELHESGIYNRIRSRLNMKNNLAFADIPDAIIKREKDLKTKISSSLTTTENINSYFEVNKKWTQFVDSLKQDYPKYYNMRYATIEEPIDNLQNNLSENSTVVRYLFIDEELYSFVVTKTTKDLFKLNYRSVENHIAQLAENQSDISKIGKMLHELHQVIWDPFEEKINTENVVIIPDGQLFNLSFETLTPSRVSSFKDMILNSLLTKHSISYNYSLLLLDEGRKTMDYSNDFVAFAPEFNKQMKDDYKLAVTDPISIDKTYLTLLPQPFSVDLAKEFSKLFNGSSFINEKASKQIFTKEANEHKIIHIGTHAESNNISPELSRLIFAKSPQEDDNSLYTYEIYNQNLNANLAILTACETGKPTFQSGEGMISLAHAFNYAGSESILTSLWKIDEQSSTQIVKSFYDHISQGQPKDAALRLAKLDYIKNAEGRTAHPQYWAGLVLIGDASPIDMSTSFPFWLKLLLYGVLAVGILLLIYKWRIRQ